LPEGYITYKVSLYPIASFCTKIFPRRLTVCSKFLTVIAAAFNAEVFVLNMSTLMSTCEVESAVAFQRVKSVERVLDTRNNNARISDKLLPSEINLSASMMRTPGSTVGLLNV